MISDWEVNCVVLAKMLEECHPDEFQNLQQTLHFYGIEVRQLECVRDYWARDYCPIQVGDRKLVKFKYDPDYLKNYPELRTGDEILKCFLDFGQCQYSNINLDGGNIVATATKAILTDKIYKENPEYCPAELCDNLQKMLQVDELIVIPKEPYDPIGHVDAMVRFIDERSVFVNDYAQVDPSFNERLVKVLRRHRLAIETLPYFHEKHSKDGIPSAVGCYTNFLRTGKVLLAPTYGTEHDELAIKKLQSAFPGLPIVSIQSTGIAREGGALNCVAATYHILQKTAVH